MHDEQSPLSCLAAKHLHLFERSRTPHPDLLVVDHKALYGKPGREGVAQVSAGQLGMNSAAPIARTGHPGERPECGAAELIAQHEAKLRDPAGATRRK